MAKNHKSSVSVKSKKYKDYRFYDTNFVSCCYCNRPLDRENATTEHIIPLASGGKRGDENLAICCANCNNNHSAILSANINMEKNPNYTNNKKAIDKARVRLENRKNFWKNMHIFKMFDFLKSEMFFGDKDIALYQSAAYFYCGYKTLKDLDITDDEKKLINDSFYRFA
jgi:hypothetical protein